MANGEKKGITVKVDADLHAEVSAYLAENNMTMAQFVSIALQDELHPKIKEENNMGPMRTIAVQVSEEMYQKIKEYLKRHGISQKDFLNGLLEREIERDLVEQANQKEKLDALNEEDAEEELEEAEETEAQAQIAEAEEEDELSEDEVSEDESMGYDGPSMVM